MRHLSAIDLSSLSAVSLAFHEEANSNDLWAALHAARWPAWTLLSCPSTDRKCYEDRINRVGVLNLREGRAFLLRGEIVDSYDSNRTPVRVILSRAPRDGPLAPTQLIAEVYAGAGTLHNTPQQRVWVGSLNELGVSGERKTEWSESATFGQWKYSGSIHHEGRAIEGVFFHNCLPRKCGKFSLRACEPGDVVLPTPTQLAKRVLVRWQLLQLEKRKARASIVSTYMNAGT
jgi:hypothetical protein